MLRRWGWARRNACVRLRLLRRSFHVFDRRLESVYEGVGLIPFRGVTAVLDHVQRPSELVVRVVCDAESHDAVLFAPRHALIDEPARLVAVLAEGLVEFHAAAPARLCPFDFRVEAALAHVRSRVGSGTIDPESDFYPEHRHLSLEAAVRPTRAVGAGG